MVDTYHKKAKNLASHCNPRIMTQFQPFHINADSEDLAGNNGIGRYVLLPGSNGRAHEIAQCFDNLTTKSHSRGHHLYLGTLTSEGQIIDVATIASGMGFPSKEIILDAMGTHGPCNRRHIITAA